MDGDSAAKTMDRGAASATKSQDMTEGIHEDVKHDLGGPPAGEKTQGTATSMFDAQGSIGKQFTTEGAIGGTAQMIGGPFDQQGAIGKQFTHGGSIGGSVQENIAQGEKGTFQKAQ